MMRPVEIRNVRHAWTERDSSGNVVEHFDMVETWARLPGLGVWMLIGSVPVSSLSALVLQ